MTDQYWPDDFWPAFHPTEQNQSPVRGNLTDAATGTWTENAAGGWWIWDGYVNYMPRWRTTTTSTTRITHPSGSPPATVCASVGTGAEAAANFDVNAFFNIDRRSATRMYPLRIASTYTTVNSVALDANGRDSDQYRWEGADFPDPDRIESWYEGLVMLGIDPVVDDVIVLLESFMAFTWDTYLGSGGDPGSPASWSALINGSEVYAGGEDSGSLFDVFGPEDEGGLDVGNRVKRVWVGEDAPYTSLIVPMPSTPDEAEGTTFTLQMNNRCFTREVGGHGVYLNVAWLVHLVAARRIRFAQPGPTPLESDTAFRLGKRPPPRTPVLPPPRTHVARRFRDQHR